ncbi:hypothetical protein [Streptococcus gordonii]|uniref:hypothetical protein n=1 Tax=Streptococcus gordonii TaxID=1302 RepID=UPI00077972AF|nr:hypothetical protein [Streptococcus gordonii]
MKKIYTLALLVFSVFILTACSSQEAWLNGTWKGEKNKKTFVFEEKQGKWTILNGKEKIAEKGEVKDKKGDQFTIVDANGNRHQIKKVDENTIEYQPFTSDGISATNGESFKFKKEK